MSRGRKAWGNLIPRPFSLLGNSLMFGGGVLFAWLEGYGRQAGSGRSIYPSWLFVLLWFLVQEVLVQQAKYMWNDGHDHERDQKIPANRKRPIARQPLSPTTTVLMSLRWICGIFLAGLLSPDLLTVVLMISGLQIVYELWAKPSAAQRPTVPLYLVGAGALLKGAGGFLAMGSPAGDQRLWLYGLAMFATGIVFISSFWRVEADYFRQNGLAWPRGQSAYYARQGLAWLQAGTAVTIAACTLLMLDGYTHFLARTELTTAPVIGLICAAGLFCCQGCFWLAPARREIRFTAAALFVCGCAGYLWFRVVSLFPISNETFTAALLLLVLMIDHRLNTIMDYKQQNLLYFSENWPDLRRLVYMRVQRPGSVLHWRYLLQLVLVLNTPKYRLLRDTLDDDWGLRSTNLSGD